MFKLGVHSTLSFIVLYFSVSCHQPFNKSNLLIYFHVQSYQYNHQSFEQGSILKTEFSLVQAQGDKKRSFSISLSSIVYYCFVNSMNNISTSSSCFIGQIQKKYIEKKIPKFLYSAKQVVVLCFGSVFVIFICSDFFNLNHLCCSCIWSCSFWCLKSICWNSKQKNVAFHRRRSPVL